MFVGDGEPSHFRVTRIFEVDQRNDKCKWFEYFEIDKPSLQIQMSIRRSSDDVKRTCPNIRFSGQGIFLLSATIHEMRNADVILEPAANILTAKKSYTRNFANSAKRGLPLSKHKDKIYKWEELERF